MGSESFTVLILEPERARVCRFTLELRGETLWSAEPDKIAERLASAPPEIVAVVGDFKEASKVAEQLRKKGLADSVFLITGAADGEPVPTGQVRVIVPEGYSNVKPESLLDLLRNAILEAHAAPPVSPLTGLPSTPALDESIKQRVRAKQFFVYLYLDIDNFKAFNDIYGTNDGDRAIRFLGSEIVEATRELGNPSDLYFHIGGDDFAIMTSADRAEPIAMRIISKFDRGIPGFYSAEDRERGHIEAESRRGELQEFPLMTLSIAGVDTAYRHIEGYPDLSRITTEVKGYAKALEGSQFVMDRRRDPEEK